jgi:hypothetical protein
MAGRGLRETAGQRHRGGGGAGAIKGVRGA